MTHSHLGLPHSIHVHCNNLGHPGNSSFTLDTFDVLKKITPSETRNSTMHFTHAQFNSYGGSDWKSLNSGAADVAEYLNKKLKLLAKTESLFHSGGMPVYTGIPLLLSEKINL